MDVAYGITYDDFTLREGYDSSHTMKGREILLNTDTDIPSLGFLSQLRQCYATGLVNCVTLFFF